MAAYRVVKLLKNEQYPTYQLYAQMAEEKLSPADGLLKAVRCILDWLLQRLGENAPVDLREHIEADGLPFSYHISQGYLIDIVYLPERGSWSLLITEPDLGSDPGNPEQSRPAVPGRIIETNVGFCISGKVLECGFQTIVSDPEGTASDADVYRLAPVRRLMEDPEFGLRQLTELKKDVQEITSQDGLKALQSTWHDARNQLPIVIFTEAAKESGVRIFPRSPVSPS